ncbi:MAG: helix-turn-helix domain-containing protein [Clostridiales bacterium]|nr:helix-turn-helix domain-containing protein [Clostridiales bacterium]
MAYFDKKYILADSGLVVDRIKVDKEIIRDYSLGKLKSLPLNIIKKKANNLKLLRELSKLSVVELAKSIGLSYSAYINLESGNQKISTKIMWRLVKKFKVPLELIINVDEYL